MKEKQFEEGCANVGSPSDEIDVVEFNDRLKELVAEAREDGVHVRRIMNSLKSQYNDLELIQEAWNNIEGVN